MAQDFERAVASDSTSDINIGTTARTVVTSNSDYTQEFDPAPDSQVWD